MKINSDKYPQPYRFRHHTSPNMYIPADELKEVPDSYPPLIEKADWGEIFINGLAPNMLDIGCGRGAFLLDMAELYPEKNILGIELRKAPVEWLKTIIEGEKIPNCSIIWYSVVNGLGFIDEKSIDKVFYLFPDPWPKKKHHKRRAFTTEMLSEIHRVLNDEGKLYLATDMEEVHGYHIEVLHEFKKFDYQILESDDEWNLPVTNKEKFCRKNQIPFYRIIGKKK